MKLELDGVERRNARMNMKRHALLSLLTVSSFSFSSLAQAVTTDVVGYVSTVLPGGVGSIFAPSFVNADSVAGTIESVISSPTDSTFTISGLTANQYNTGSTFPTHYLEILNDTNSSDGLDTEGVILDIVSNTTSSVVVAADTSSLGIQGDEQFAIRKHLTLGDIFEGSTGLVAFGTPITIYNGLFAGSIETYLPDGSGGFVEDDFVTSATDAVVYPGTGIVVINSADVTILVTGTVKETPTQVSLYANQVNIVSALKPLSTFDLTSDGSLDSAFVAFSDPITQYTSGTLSPDNTVLTDGSGGVLEQDFVTPGTLVLNDPSAAIVAAPIGDRVYKTSGISIPE